MNDFDKIMLYAVWPIGLVSAVMATLMGYGLISPGVPDKGDELSVAKRRRMLKWLGPAMIIGIVLIYVLKLTGVS